MVEVGGDMRGNGVLEKVLMDMPLPLVVATMSDGKPRIYALNHEMTRLSRGHNLRELESLLEDSAPGGSSRTFNVRLWGFDGELTLSPYGDGKVCAALKLAERGDEKSSRRLLELIPDLVLVFNREGVYVDCHTQGGQRDLLMPPADFIGKNVRELLPPDLSGRFHACLSRVLESGMEETLNYSLEINGREQGFEVSFLPGRDGEVICVAHKSAIHDIPEIREAFSHAPLGMALIDRRLRLVRCNHALAGLTGIGGKELQGRRLAELIHQEDWKQGAESFRLLFRGETGRLELEQRILGRDGAEHWTQLSASPLHGSSGEVEYVIATVLPTRESRRERERSETKLAQLKAVTKSGYWEVDYNSGRVVCDTELHELFAYPVGMALNTELLRAMIHPQDLALTELAYLRAVRSGKDFNIVHRIIDGHGAVRHVAQRGTTEFGEDGHPLRTLGMAYDISDLKEAEHGLKWHNRILHSLIESTQRLLEDKDVSGSIREALRALCSATDTSRAYMFDLEKHRDGSFVCRFSHEWNQPGIPGFSTDPSLRKFILSDMELVEGLLEKRATLLSAGSAPLAIRELMELLQTRSLAVLPIFIDGELSGFIGVDDCRRERLWQESELDILRLFAETIGLVAERREHESRLQKTMRSLERNELLLKKSEHRYRSLVNAIPDLICIHDRNGYIVDCSMGPEGFFGYRDEDFLGMHVSSFLTGENSQHICAAIDKVLKTGETMILGCEQTHRNGQYQVCEVRIVPYNSDMVMAIVRDVTEHRRIERALRNSEGKFKLLFERMISGATLFEPVRGDGDTPWRYRFIDANASYEKLSGMKAQELRGRFFDEIFSECSWMDTLHDVAYYGNTRVFELYHDDTARHYYCSAFRPDSGSNYFCVIFNDITAQKQFEADLIKAKERAEESDRLKSAFLANMSHEIRTPLNTIIGLASLMAENDLDRHEKSRYSAMINQSSSQLLTLISDIIDIARIESGELRLDYRNVRLGQMMERLHDIFSAKLSRNGQTQVSLLYRKNPGDDELIIHSDETRLTQILSNLLGNAVKFTLKGFIEFGCEADLESREIRFFVRDSGPGIPPDRQEIIFERFRQADDSLTRKHGGTGLGLAICKHLCNLLGGKIWLNSVPGEGSCFYFTVPYVRKNESLAEKNKQRKSLPSDDGSRWPGKTVVVADDTPTVQFYLKRLLELAEVNCLLASNGMEAVELCRTQTVDLVLMDIQMPEMNGLEATAAIKSLKPSLPVLAQTAHALAGDRERIIASGCDDYIVKPIRKDTLMEKLSGYFKKP